MRVGFFTAGRTPQDQDHEGGKENQPQAAEGDGSSRFSSLILGEGQ